MRGAAALLSDELDVTCALLDALEARRRAALAERQNERLVRLLLAVPPASQWRSKERAPMKSLYKVLGLGPGATPPEIRHAHRQLARQHHTDRAGGDKARFQEVQEAYETLIDPVRRREYDAQRAIWLAEQEALDCLRCATPNRVRVRGVATRCAACKAPLTEETAEGRVKLKAMSALSGATKLVEGLVETVVEESVNVAQDAVRSQFARMRTRLNPRAGRKE